MWNEVVYMSNFMYVKFVCEDKWLLVVYVRVIVINLCDWIYLIVW